MKVLVLGGGVIGVTSAWYLAGAGHEVAVVDRQSEPARETSFANGGQVSWGAGGPWAAPGMPRTALKWLFRPHSPLVLRPRFDPALWRWLVQMLGNCTAARYLINKERQLRLARYSHAALAALRADTGIDYDARTGGALVVQREARALDDFRAERDLLDRLAIPYRVLDRAGCIAHEPALARVAERIAGGVLYPGDELGDCRAFTLAVAERAQQRGVHFRGSTTVQGLEAEGGRIVRVHTDRGPLEAQAFVLACGSYSPLLARPLGLRLPVYPVKGYSITLPIANADAAPRGTLTDEHYRIVISRLGGRVRAAGTAELAGYDLRLRPGRIDTLKHSLGSLFPGAGELDKAEAWAGLRPMTPDNPPLLGATPFRNLYLNTGHGTLGWTMACGSGRVLADLVSGREPAIDLDGLTLARYA